jgi:hypothetical protein
MPNRLQRAGRYAGRVPRLRRQQLTGLAELEQEWECEALPSAFAASRVVRLIDRYEPRGQGPLWLWTWAAASTIVIAARGEEFIGAISAIRRFPNRSAKIPAVFHAAN